jgi:hypothetical protein
LPAIHVEDRSTGRSIKVAASRGDVLQLLKTDGGFRDAFTKVLAEAPHAGFFWETPPLSSGTKDRPFECVLVPSAAIGALSADRQPFAPLIDAGAGSEAVVRSPNLGGDAELVIPCDGGAADYAHLAAFLRTASHAQIHNLWRVTAETAEAWLDCEPQRPIWLSTAGLGVSWLHVRVDTRPKYYSHAPYRQPSA